MYQHLSHMTWGVYATKNTAYSLQNTGWNRTKWNNEWLILGLQTKNKCIPQPTLYNIKSAILNFLIVLIRHITKQIYQILKWSHTSERIKTFETNKHHEYCVYINIVWEYQFNRKVPFVATSMWPSKALRFLKSHLWLSCFFVITCFTLWAYYLWDWIATFSFLMMICVILLLHSNRIRTYMRMPCRENYSQSVVTGCCSGAH